MPQDIFGDHFPIEVEFHELESVEIRIVGAIPAEIPQLQLFSDDKVDDGREPSRQPPSPLSRSCYPPACRNPDQHEL